MEDDDQNPQTRREAPVTPVPQMPDLAGKRGGKFSGNPLFLTPPPAESGIGKSPVSRFGRDRESRSRGRLPGISGSQAGTDSEWHRDPQEQA